MADPSSAATNEPAKSNGDAPRGRGSKPDTDYFTFRRIPPIGYTLQNIVISIGTVISSFAALCFTMSFVLPLSILRRSVPPRTLSLAATAGKDFKLDEVLTRGRVVLVVGVTREMGYDIIMQYANDKDTTIIGLAQTAEMAQDMRMAFHDWPATFQAEVLDLSSSPESTARIIQDCNKKYGPISHMYALAGCPTQNRRNPHWGMDTTIDLVKINVLGIVSAALSMYECMKSRRYGKICIVGSIFERNSASNMISHPSTQSFMITFASKLRVRASTSNIDVVIVDPDFINSGIAKKIGANTAKHAGPQLMAALMKEAVEMGGVGVVNLPITHSVKVYALRALNPICEEIWNWTAMKVGLGKKTTRSG